MSGEYFLGGRRSSLPAPSQCGLFVSIWSADDRNIGSIMRQDGEWVAYLADGQAAGSFPTINAAVDAIRRKA